jgi:hypothetical protein
MSLAVVLAGALALQQLEVAPFPATVGEPVVVHAKRGDAPIAGLAVRATLPDGSEVACGETAANGECRFVPEHAGQHVFIASIDGVRTLAPLAVRAARARWPLAIGAVPLGLALLWWNLRALSRARGRRAP